tara:strand:+ start:936 stop:1676 length:741 start_codon:yes stop_codon:yes gene_type:complete
MGRAKEIIVKVIKSKIANTFIKKNHYSKKVVNNSSLHFGCFLDKQLHGVMSYGSPLDKRKILPIVKNTKWNEMLELNRMAFDEFLPKYSESRCIAISIKLIKKNAPHIKWILSFSDGTQCGDGTIYRASGFELIGIKKNYNLCLLPNGKTIHKMTLESNPNALRKELNNTSYYDLTNGKYDFKKYVEKTNAKILEGYQLKYIYFVNKKNKKNLTLPIIPFSEIDKQGAGMYKGKKITLKERQNKRD